MHEHHEHHAPEHAIGIGSIVARPVIELADVRFQPAHFFDTPDAGIIHSHQHWLAPRFFDADSGSMRLSHHSWLIDTGTHKILVDPCVGNHKPRHLIADYDMLDTPWLQRLAAAGARPEEIDYVFCTHLHVDHCGWNTRLDNGRWVPTFPNARYLFSRSEHDFWSVNFGEPLPPMLDVNHGVYADSVRPVIEAGQAMLLDEATNVAGCLQLEFGIGHTLGHMVGTLTDGDAGLLFAGDALHHPLQIVQPDWNTSGCMLPEVARATRRRLLGRCADQGWLLAAAHFMAPYALRIARDGAAFKLA